MEQEASPVNKKTKRTLWPVIVLPLFFVAAIAFGIYYFIQVQNPLQDFLATDLASVTVISAEGGENEFPVHPQRWTKMLKNFESSVVNWTPSKWTTIGTIRFELKDGRVFSAEVFDTRGDVGCFKIGDVYYTGGSQALVDRILTDGFKKIGVQKL